MRTPVVAVPASVIVAIALFASVDVGTGREEGALGRSEVARLRAHFDSVLVELRGRDVSRLRPNQRRARAQLIGVLQGYRDAGVFPHNHDFAGERVPYFRDEHGTLCAMAYLVAATGRDDIVGAIAERRNNAYIPELATDPRLGAWLDSVGLTVAEAARIQPEYDGRLPITIVPEDRDPARYVLPSVALGIPALFTTVANWRAPRAKRADGTVFVGALSGAAAAILGGAILAGEGEGSMRMVGVADLTLGSAALVAAVRRSLRFAGGRTSQPPVAATESRLTIDVTPSRHGDRTSATTRVRFLF